MSTSGRLVWQYKGAKMADYELNITITPPSLLTSYFINLNWNWMKKIPYWIFFKFASRGKRRVGVVSFQLKRETDAGGISHTLFDEKITKWSSFSPQLFPWSDAALHYWILSGTRRTFILGAKKSSFLKVLGLLGHVDMLNMNLTYLNLKKAPGAIHNTKKSL